MGSDLFSAKALQKAADEELARVRAEKPNSFRVGAAADVLAKRAEFTASYDRKISNGLGLTAYLKAWWHDQAVIPADRRGVLIGAEGKVDF